MGVSARDFVTVTGKIYENGKIYLVAKSIDYNYK